MLEKEEIQRLIKGITAAYAFSFIDDIEDYIWEAIFAYAKNLLINDPLINTRKKLLFDIVDSANNIGWSLKSIQHVIKIPSVFEVVIQRADIFKKAEKLGFSPLNLSTPTNIIGSAILKHWNCEKVLKDAREQSVTDMRICILIKSKDRTKYAYFEDKISMYTNEELKWFWTDASKTGLQGVKRCDNTLIYRWYPNQKQLFESFILSEDADTFTLEPKRIPIEDSIELLYSKLEDI